MPWFRRMFGFGGAPKAPAVPAPAPANGGPLAVPPAASRVGPAPPIGPTSPSAGNGTARAPSPFLAAQVAAAKAAAEVVRKEQAKASAREVLQSLGLSLPPSTPVVAPPPPSEPLAAPPLLSAERKALITDAMHHWAHGHAIYQRLDPGIKERVRMLAERMMPK